MRCGIARQARLGWVWFVGGRYGEAWYGAASHGALRYGTNEKEAIELIYKWKNYNYKTSAAIAGEVCEELDRTVGLTPDNLVDASRPDDAPLHNEFEWDDATAAEEFRRVQARLIISNLSIVIEENKQEPVRAFFSLQGGFRKNSGIYESTITIMTDEQKREKLLDNAKRELDAFVNKYQILTELADVFKAINDVRSK